MAHLFEDQLENYVLGRSSPEDSDRILEHLLVCGECRKLHAEIETYVGVMRASIEPGPTYDLSVLCGKDGFGDDARAISALMAQRGYSLWPEGEKTWTGATRSGEAWFGALRRASRESSHLVLFDRGARHIAWQERELGPRAQRVITLYHDATLLYFGLSNVSHPYRSLREAVDIIADALLLPREPGLPDQPSGKPPKPAKADPGK